MSDRKEMTLPNATPYQGLTGTYTIDPVHSSIGFSVRHAMITNVRGKFTGFEGLLRLDGARPTRSEAHVSVQTASLDTGIAQRDAHVTGPDFLDPATFPLMSFHSTGIVDAGDGRFRMSGGLRNSAPAAGGVLISDKVKLVLDISAIRLDAEATELHRLPAQG